MLSTILRLVLFMTFLHLGLNNTINGNFPPLVNSKSAMSSRVQQQSSGLATLGDILLLRSLSERDIDIEVGEYSFYIDPFTTGNTSPRRSIRPQSRPKSMVTRTTSKPHKPHNSNGGSTFANLFCAYCLQFGFNLCVQRFCFEPLT